MRNILLFLIDTLLGSLILFTFMRLALGTYEVVKHKRLTVTDKDAEQHLTWPQDKRKILYRGGEHVTLIALGSIFFIFLNF